MLGIKELHAGQNQAYAVVSDGIKDYRVELGRQSEHIFFVYDMDGKVKEAYPSLQDTIYSIFGDIFRLLYRNLTACNVIYGRGILQDITSSKDFVKLADGHYRGSNIFSWKGEKNIACIEYDLTKEIPDYYYSVSDIDLTENEGYNALYQAVDSEYYPILADLDNDLTKYMQEN